MNNLADVDEIILTNFLLTEEGRMTIDSLFIHCLVVKESGDPMLLELLLYSSETPAIACKLSGKQELEGDPLDHAILRYLEDRGVDLE